MLAAQDERRPPHRIRSGRANPAWGGDSHLVDELSDHIADFTVMHRLHPDLCTCRIDRDVWIDHQFAIRIGRAHLTGSRAGSYDVLWDDLPGLPDGMDRDSKGRIWVALIKDRTPLMTWMHANPWIKPLILRVPPRYLPRTLDTGVLALSADAGEVLAYSHHDGSRVVDGLTHLRGGGELRPQSERMSNLVNTTPRYLPMPR